MARLASDFEILAAVKDLLQPLRLDDQDAVCVRDPVQSTQGRHVSFCHPAESCVAVCTQYLVLEEHKLSAGVATTAKDK